MGMQINLPSTPVDEFQVRYFSIAHARVQEIVLKYHVNSKWGDVCESKGGADFVDDWQVFVDGHFSGRKIKWISGGNTGSDDFATRAEAVNALRVKFEELAGQADAEAREYREKAAQLNCSPLPAQVEGLATELLPCPFCGNVPVWSNAFVRVRCNHCYIGTQKVTVDVAELRGKDVIKREAFEAWNTRADSTKAKVEKLEAALKLLSVRINPKDSQCMHCWCNTWDWTKHSLKCEAIRAVLIESPGQIRLFGNVSHGFYEG